MWQEYIESTGSQYINTGYVAQNPSLQYELDMTWTGTNTGDFETFIGFMPSVNGNVPRAGLHKLSSTLFFGGDDTKYSEVIPVSGERFNFYGDFITKNQKLYKNNTLIASSTHTFNPSSNTLSTYIFARNKDNARNNGAKMKLYRAKIYEEYNTIYEFIPVRNAAGVLGLYDIINNQFYTNAGSGDFIAGPALTTGQASMLHGGGLTAREIIEI